MTPGILIRICKWSSEFFPRLPTDRKLQQHLKNDHDPQKLFICDKCGKIFKNSYNLKKPNDMEHTERKLTPEPQQCKLCGTWYRHLAGLKMHMKNIHENTSDERRCHICISTTERALKRHIYLNNKCVHKFKCSMCLKAFKRGQDLREYISVHTGEALYTCPNCPMTFASSANMRKRELLEDKAGGKYERKSSAPIPNFFKLSFSTSSSSPTQHNNRNLKAEGGKGKKLLGSLLLHRIIFGHHHDDSNKFETLYLIV
uniref:C2H2-type domain-containing protein n=1 Tax=Glossina palpalis gambiensis TaxID=67801 RepID=A0A1B0BVU0_9MUSC